MTEEEKVKPSPANNNYTLSMWEQRWSPTDRNITFHQKSGNQLMWKHLDKLITENFPGRKPEDLKVLVPLCGKSYDMYLLYKLGCTVVGIEYAPLAITEFFEDNGLTETNTANQPYTMTADGRLILGQGDLFLFNDVHKLPFDKYDVIWDRGSYEALNEQDRSRYAQLMQSLLDNNGVHMLCVHEYDRNEYGGPPLATTKEELAEYFGNEKELTEIESVELTAEGHEQRERWTQKGLSKMTEVLYVLK
ncbi:thiopurine S-methyltransferase-like [Watersipora subatra]|uniref:thiopurine S-methyltransferase-like n=1 Tax=Watersipora subatra TaxID=2589382 RepID=UPI00355C37C8